MSSKKICITMAGIILSLLIVAGSITIIVDPFFHYHAPMKCQSYSLYNQRYQNNGITRHFEYDALIIGTSMTENFKSSLCDSLFKVKSVKTPYAGASYKELNEAIVNAIKYNDELKMVVLGIDTTRLFVDKDYMRYKEYPEYLYDENPFNDVNYIFNKEILLDDTFKALRASLKGESSTTFDEYSNHSGNAIYEKNMVMKEYSRPQQSEMKIEFTESDKKILRETISQNLIDTIEKNPQVEFYLFFSPYSILYWDSKNQENSIEQYIEGIQMATEMLVPYENIHLYSFFEEYSTICDLDNYKDWLHYSPEINDNILKWMKEGEHMLTKENYKQHINALKEFYMNYDYDALFK